MTGTVPQTKENRKTREDRKAHFKSALAMARTTAKEWCEANRVSATHLYAVLNGDRESMSLLARVDAFIELHQQQGNGAR